DFPTAAAHPDASNGPRHPNGLRYSTTDARRITSAPGGCLFAVGKIDGSVEVWAPKGLPLPDRPDDFVTPEWPYRARSTESPPKQFHRLWRTLPHSGAVESLSFTMDCRSLLTVSGRTLKEFVEGPQHKGVPSYYMPVYEQDAHSAKVVRTLAATGETEWECPTDFVPAAFAVDHHSLVAPPGGPGEPRFAVVSRNHNLQIRSLTDGRELQSFSIEPEVKPSSVHSVSFGNTDGYIWAVSSRYTGERSGVSVIQLSSWDLHRRQLIAVAEIPGQLMAAEWDRFGFNLATLRYLPELAQLNSDRRDSLFPWDTPPPSPFQFHVWKVKNLYAQ
ncbi:MAG: hypothetical protein KDA89_21385, partial [Planctomycetaceae bacterium]|nr:hypothetical protein [Planctomycetaceae bacterium]